MLDRSLKALSLILSYPSRELQEAMPDIGAVLADDRRITAETRAALRSLTNGFADADLYDLQESYVMLFDRSRTLSLNLFEHVHGESRDRGGAILVISEELEELIALSDRIVVLYGGRKSGEVARSSAEIETIGRLMLGASA